MLWCVWVCLCALCRSTLRGGLGWVSVGSQRPVSASVVLLRVVAPTMSRGALWLALPLVAPDLRKPRIANRLGKAVGPFFRVWDGLDLVLLLRRLINCNCN